MKTPILPYALFDMDGTLVDSMGYWRRMPIEYLTARGIRPDAEGLRRIETARGYDEVIAYFASLGISATMPDILRFVEAQMARHYRDEIRVKPGVPALLDTLRAAGCRMGIITLTPHAGAELCLSKTGLSPYFEFVLTPEDMPGQCGKEEPGIFEEGLRRLGCAAPGECLFFEDSYYAIKTAVAMGLRVVGVEDAWAAFERDRIAAAVGEYLDLGEVAEAPHPWDRTQP